MKSHTKVARLSDRIDRRPAMNACTTHQAEQFELRFASLFREGRGLSFPCDRAGEVDLDTLSARARANYFFARSVVGRDFAQPSVRRALH
jgi:hypothetical protein